MSEPEKNNVPSEIAAPDNEGATNVIQAASDNVVTIVLTAKSDVMDIESLQAEISRLQAQLVVARKKAEND